MLSSRPNGQVMSLSPPVRQMNSLIASTAIFDATSPAACPPMPSATTNRFCSALTKWLSSFPLRLRPTSVTAWNVIFMGGSLRRASVDTESLRGGKQALVPRLLQHAEGARVVGAQAQGGLRRAPGAQLQPLPEQHFRDQNLVRGRT